MNRMERGVRSLIRRLQLQASVTIRYYLVADGTQYIDLVKKSWLGNQKFRSTSNDKSIVEWSDADIFIPVEDLIYNSSRVLPRRGHWITIVQPDPKAAVRFEVFAPEGERVFRYSDPQCLLYRIHTRESKGS